MRHRNLKSLAAGACSAAICAGGTAVASEQPAQSLTMARIASAPFPYDLSAAPRDGAVAWVYNERGARNLWVAERDPRGEYAARRLTPYTADDGNDITGLAWNGDGTTLFYTRGGDWNGRLSVNPMSLPEGARPPLPSLPGHGEKV